MLSKPQEILLKTILYSDIFDYPLTRDQIRTYLISDHEISNFQFSIFNFREIQSKNGFYFLRGRENLVQLHQKREKVSEKKIEIAKKAATILSTIPTILFIGISGNVAMYNAEEEDDIDLFIITQKNALWSTRLVATVLSDILGIRRKKGQKNVKDKICLNYFIDESSLTIPKDRQDLYTAHEVVQVLPIFDRNDMYQKFINANKWVTKFLPNALNKKVKVGLKSTPGMFSFLFSVIEPLSRVIQKSYMKHPAETETITKTVLAFHPEDYRGKVMREYEKRVKKLV